MSYPQMVLNHLLQKEAVFCVRAPDRTGMARSKAAKQLLTVSPMKVEVRYRRRITTQGRLQLKSKADFGVRSLKDKTETGPGS